MGILIGTAIGPSVHRPKTVTPSFSPLDIPDIDFWFIFARAYLDLVGNDIEKATDQGGLDHHLLQAVGARRPLSVTTGGPKGRGYVEFDNVQQEWLKAVAWTRDQPYTTVANLLPTVSGGTFLSQWDGDLGNSGRLVVGDPSSNLTMLAGVQLVHAGVAVTNWLRVATVYNGASSSIAVNDGVPTTGDAGANDPGGLTVGAFGGLTVFGDSRFDELIGYSRVLTAEELTLLDVWMTP